MPLYEFRCKKCGMVQELLLYGIKKTAPACSACGSMRLEKLISAHNVNTRSAGSPCTSPGCSSGTQCGASSCAAGGSCPKMF